MNPGARILITLDSVLLLCSPANAQRVDQIREEVRQLTSHLPFAMPAIAVPSFPDHHVTITDFGARADGRTLNTKAFESAVRSVAEAGGGTVTVPPGTWLTGPIRLQSNICLHLERGALIQFSRHLEDFPLIPGLGGKSKKYIITPLIAAYRANHIAITGAGVIDGAGEVWRYVKRSKLTEHQWKDLLARGGVVSPDGKEWWPSKEALEGEKTIREMEKSGRALSAADYAQVREYLRPDLLELVQCNGILLDGTTFQNSPRYHVRPVQSENVIIRDIKVYAPWYGQNTDGIDPTSCRNVIVYNATVDVGDDGICLKPGSLASEQTPGPACENIVVANCAVYHAHGGFVIGSESFGGVRNVSVSNCLFLGSDVGLRFKSARGRGGVVEDVFIEGIQMRDIQDEAILFDMYYGGGAPEVEAAKARATEQPEPVTPLTPRFQKFTIKNVVCNGAGQAVRINGLPEMPVKRITLENVSITSERGLSFVDVDSLRIRSCSFLPRIGPVVVLDECRDVTVEGVSYGGAEVFLSVGGERTEDVRLIGLELPKVKKALDLGAKVRPGAVLWK
jgi:DNA sulfur modification protein DndE